MPDNKSMMTRLEALGPVLPNPEGEAAVRRLVADRPDADELLAMILPDRSYVTAALEETGCDHDDVTRAGSKWSCVDCYATVTVTEGAA